jgi:hypothetical protein
MTWPNAFQRSCKLHGLRATISTITGRTEDESRNRMQYEFQKALCKDKIISRTVRAETTFKAVDRIGQVIERYLKYDRF